MDNFPNDILYIILYSVDNLTLLRARKVCTKWKKIIEDKIFYKDHGPTIEQCIINADYYHFRKYYHNKVKSFFNKFLKIKIKNKYLSQLSVIVNDKVFIKYYDGPIAFSNNIIHVFDKYLEKGDKYHTNDVLKFFIREFKQCNVNNKLVDAFYKKQFKFINLLLAEYNFDLNGIYYKNYTLLELIILNSDRKILNGFNDDSDNEYDDYSDIFECASNYLFDYDTITFLLDKGADIHANNDGALRISINAQNIPRTKWLLEKGANINIVHCCKIVQKNKMSKFIKSLKID